ncbi:hypothetical protein DEO72_LG3g1450 [Vigna unguiculata]|uniref:Uncharacterized protein n=1 Tax=Vigna unguiculata TaxID=3917 RepID=A0A4D6LE84_VIGUN|nr:hypothetical protein DEO72_LG3g1450 [Vigna unguiculata]
MALMVFGGVGAVLGRTPLMRCCVRVLIGEPKHIRQRQYSNFQKCHQHQAFGLGSLRTEAINGTFGLGCNRTEAYKSCVVASVALSRFTDCKSPPAAVEFFQELLLPLQTWLLYTSTQHLISGVLPRTAPTPPNLALIHIYTTSHQWSSSKNCSYPSKPGSYTHLHNISSVEFFQELLLPLQTWLLYTSTQHLISGVLPRTAPTPPNLALIHIYTTSHQWSSSKNCSYPSKPGSYTHLHNISSVEFFQELLLPLQTWLLYTSTQHLISGVLPRTAPTPPNLALIHIYTTSHQWSSSKNCSYPSKPGSYTHLHNISSVEFFQELLLPLQTWLLYTSTQHLISGVLPRTAPTPPNTIKAMLTAAATTPILILCLLTNTET